VEGVRVPGGVWIVRDRVVLLREGMNGRIEVLGLRKYEEVVSKGDKESKRGEQWC